MKGTLSNQDFNTLLTVLRNQNYTIFEKPYQLNIVGIRTDSFVPNSFNDFIIVFYKDETGNWVVNKYSATTDPGTYWLKNPMAPKGTAILKKGQYPGSHQIGLHKGNYTALVQKGPVTVIRDYDRDNQLSYNSMKSDTSSSLGINIHRAAPSGQTERVDKYSAGCQVFNSANDFAEFIAAAKKHANLYGNSFTYTLIDERENSIRAKAIGDKFAAGEYNWYPGSTGLPIDIYFGAEIPLIKKPVDNTTHCSGFTFAVFFVTALNRGLLTDFTDDDIKKLFDVWNQSDGSKYPKLCVKAISQPIAPNLKALGREVSLESAKAGDFCQIWRTSGAAHNAIIVEIIYEGSKITGLKYYSSNPVANPQTNKTGIGLIIEKFSDVGGTMLRDYTYYAKLNEDVELFILPTLQPPIINQGGEIIQNVLPPVETGKKKGR